MADRTPNRTFRIWPTSGATLTIGADYFEVDAMNRLRFYMRTLWGPDELVAVVDAHMWNRVGVVNG